MFGIKVPGVQLQIQNQPSILDPTTGVFQPSTACWKTGRTHHCLHKWNHSIVEHTTHMDATRTKPTTATTSLTLTVNLDSPKKQKPVTKPQKDWPPKAVLLPSIQ